MFKASCIFRSNVFGTTPITSFKMILSSDLKMFSECHHVWPSSPELSRSFPCWTMYLSDHPCWTMYLSDHPCWTMYLSDHPCWTMYLSDHPCWTMYLSDHPCWTMYLSDHPCGFEVASFVFHKVQLFLQRFSGRERFSCTSFSWTGSIN